MIHSFEYCQKKTGETGHVIWSSESIVRVTGLNDVVIGEGITFENEDHGRVIAIAKDAIEVLVLSRTPLKTQTKAVRSGSPVTISAGEGLLGHVINVMGHSITDRRHKSHPPEKRSIEVPPTGILARSRISRFLETGVAICDILMPIGKGQRELIIGDRQTGKSHFLLQTVMSQAKLGHICIYCAIGKRTTEIKAIEEFLHKEKMLDKTIIVAADSYSSPGEIFLAPYTAMTLAEYFRDKGRDVLLILDDLTTHAKYYREISLLSGHFPGREAYPGDIFHIHSSLLERAGSFHFDGKESSITCLPVAESMAGDFTGYIQTNLMSMTDGHLYFDSDLYLQGRRPPINIYLSVTRVGRQTQSSLLRDMSFQLIKFLKNYTDIQRFLRFEMELSEEIRETLRRGNQLITFFDQIGSVSIPIALQAYCVALIWKNKYDDNKITDLIKKYNEEKKFKSEVDRTCARAKTFEELIKAV